jgi:hypothetical protein
MLCWVLLVSGQITMRKGQWLADPRHHADHLIVLRR